MKQKKKLLLAISLSLLLSSMFSTTVFASTFQMNDSKLLLESTIQQPETNEKLNKQSFILSYIDKGIKHIISPKFYDLNFSQEVLQENTNKLKVQVLSKQKELLKDITKDISIKATTYPIVQSDTYPMLYENKDKSIHIDITQETYFGAVCYVAHLVLNSPDFIHTVYADDSFGSHEQASSASARTDAILLINGDYRDANYGAKLGIIRNSTVINYQPIRENAIGLTIDGHLIPIGEMSIDEALANQVRDSFTFGPILVNNYEIVATKNDVKHPRTFIGEVLRDDGKLEYYWVVADGRQPGYSIGLTDYEMACIMQEKGCSFAYNLDGGGSSTIIFNQKLLNSPSDGSERFDADFVYIK